MVIEGCVTEIDFFVSPINFSGCIYSIYVSKLNDYKEVKNGLGRVIMTRLRYSD